jgi:exodeoxyribonuclease-3
LEIRHDIGVKKHDGEGRVLTAVFDSFVLVSVYTPNAGEGLKRLKYRT